MGKKRQTAIAFSPLPSSSPAAKTYNKQVQDRAASVTYSATPNPKKRRRVDGNTQNLLPTPSATLQDASSEIDKPTSLERTSQRLKQRRIDFSGVRDPSTFDEPVRLPSSRTRSSNDAGLFSSSSRKRRTRDLSSDDSEDDAVVVGARRTRSSGSGIRANQKEDEEDEDEEDDVVPHSTAQRTPRTQRPIVLSDDEEGTEDEEDMPTTQGKRARRTRARRSSVDDFISSSPPRAIESDSDVMIVNDNDAASSDDEEDDEPITPKRRSLKPRGKLAKQEQDDLNEDLDFLEPSSDDAETSGMRPRTTQSVAKEARQQALAKLKQQRSGRVEQEVVEVESDEEDEDEDQDGRSAPLSSRQLFNEADDDQDFIDESDVENDTLGVPEEIPIEFTAFARMKAKELFKYVVEWMVQKRINPGFAMDDELYKLAFRKLDDEAKGLAGSKFKSSAWTAQFTSSLNARPDATFTHFERGTGEAFLSDRCHACNRSGHPATYEVRFLDKPYNRETLDDIDDGEEDSSSDEANENAGDRVSYDANGLEVPPENHVYYVGKFCAANAEKAHSLQHWRYHLYEAVSTMLAKDGYDHPDKVVERDRMKTKKRGKLANKIVDEMEDKGQLQDIWRVFKGNIRDARTLKQAEFGNRDDSP